MGTWATSSWCRACLCAPQEVLRVLHRLGAHLRVPRMPLRDSPSEEETAHEEAVAQAALVRVAMLR